jgi:hypothetical protein
MIFITPFVIAKEMMEPYAFGSMEMKSDALVMLTQPERRHRKELYWRNYLSGWWHHKKNAVYVLESTDITLSCRDHVNGGGQSCC